MDWNKKQIDGTNDEVMKLGDAAAKFAAFGWHAVTIHGDSVEEIYRAIEDAKKYTDQPSMIVLDTLKGGNLSCISSLANNHCIGMPPQLTENAMAELRAQGAALGMEEIV